MTGKPGLANLMKKGQIEKDVLARSFVPAGVDEVGRGCLAGPVVAACVALNYEALWSLSAKQRMTIRDSKTLSAKQRQEQLSIIRDISLDLAIAEASVQEIEQHGIVNATFLAMNRAIDRIEAPITMLLVDGHTPIRLQSLPQKAIVKGDSLCFAIAAASIIAKEHRDAYMRTQAEVYPAYGFENHVGYGTAAHLEALKSAGICPMHRRNFAPIRDMVM